MIRLRNVEKSYPTRAGATWVLRQITTDIREGEFVTIMGPSGAGKSTLLSILGAYDAGWAGEYWFREAAVHAMSGKERAAFNKREVGFVFQQFHLLDDLTVAENLDLPLSYRDVKKAERDGIVSDLLVRFGMVAMKHLFSCHLIGVHQHHLAVARAIIAKPSLLLADEPTGNLHSEQGRQVMELFRKLNGEGVTIVQVTHSEANAAYGHRILRLKDGWMEK
ncbi:MAG TPA: ABC transporter ATP-binding protein [Verrucomicrobiota bacterium]|nr:ABC transporter ATP-binding protein [Verrucomicrobiota bacterium]